MKQKKYIRIAYLIFFILAYTVYSAANEEISIEGTYWLESRVLKDGTALKPPEIFGLYNISKEYNNFNLVYIQKDGKTKSESGIFKYSLTQNQYTQETLYWMENDEISGKGLKYSFENKPGSSPVTVKEDGSIEFIYPIFNDLSAYFKGDKFIATRLDGPYIDNWVKVK
ncbi:hypothetical protein MYX76_17810 [Desulfobacterota bacterium AH_259_B03_O07]|nr:hypothetical protein [Desulfobacterota bacterium AH_259_B03_O07]